MKVDMAGYQPYRKMAATGETRPIRQRRITWTKIESEPVGNGRYQVKMLRRSLRDAAAELWRSAYPELYGSPHEFLLDPDQYEKLMALEESWQEDAASKVYCMPVVEELGTGRVVSASLLTKFEKNLQVEFSFVGTHPDYRLKDLTDELRRITRTIAERSGAEYFTTFCETWHDITQKWCLYGGWKIAGIFPGNFTRWNGDNQEYRGCEVYFYRFVGDCERFSTRPEEWRLASEAREVWEAIDRVNSRIASRLADRT
jgi:hypothetical protein